MQWKIKAPAKINIGLDVAKLKTTETKHKIKSIFALAHQYTDLITISEAGQLKVNYITNKRDIFTSYDIVTNTMKFLQTNFNISINYEITIEKHIPTKAGLGGSSADSGALIKFFVEKEKLIISKPMMQKIALELGSDIPFFISGYELALVSKYGNKLKMINKPLPHFAVHHNPITCNTQEIYAAFDQMRLKQPKNNFNKIIRSLPDLHKCIIINQLEASALQINQSLIRYKQNGFVMTGSGSYFISFEGDEIHEN